MLFEDPRKCLYRKISYLIVRDSYSKLHVAYGGIEIIVIGPLEILALAVWTFLVGYATWYFTSAKSNAPLSPAEVELLWKIHKQDKKCSARKKREIKRGNRIIGFECKCGYKHIQKRPVVAGKPSFSNSK